MAQDRIAIADQQLFEAIDQVIEEEKDKKLVKLAKITDAEKQFAQEKAEQEVFAQIEQLIASDQTWIKEFLVALQGRHVATWQEIGPLFWSPQKALGENPSWKDFLKVGSSLQLPEDLLQTLYQIGIEYYKNGKYSIALGCFLFLTGLIPDRAQVWLFQGICQQHLHQLERAFCSFQTVVTLDSRLCIAYPLMIECLLLAGQGEPAKTLYEALLQDADIGTMQEQPTFQVEMERLQKYFSKAQSN